MNESLGWIWVFLGVVSGMLLGLRFLEPGYLGGYASPRRRLLRLGHISFIGLGALNILFAHSPAAVEPSDLSQVASFAFVIAAVAMPLTCAAVAWRLALRPLFVVPVTAALAATAITALECFR